MPGEVLMALAQWAGQTVAAAAITDVWESARHKIARLFYGPISSSPRAPRWSAYGRVSITALNGQRVLGPHRTGRTHGWRVSGSRRGGLILAV
jgi:hypothetical protein